jgi:hypothetical protein
LLRGIGRMFVFPVIVGAVISGRTTLLPPTVL